MTRAVWAVVPAKSFRRGKSRLAPVLADEERAELARVLLTHVLAALRESGAIAGVLVATDGDDVAEIAARAGAAVLRDGAPASLAAVVDGALRDVAARGAEAALVLMADLPRIDADDVRALVRALDEAEAVIAPDAGGRDTNALAIAPPTAIATCFGSGESFGEHCAAARAGGLRVMVVKRDGVARDVDGPGDLERL